MIEFLPAPFKSKFRAQADGYVVTYLEETGNTGAWLTSADVTGHFHLQRGSSKLLSTILSNPHRRSGYKVVEIRKNKPGKPYEFRLVLVKPGET